MNIRFLFCIVFGALLISGCGVTIVTSGQVDGGVFRSSDGAQTWKQQVYVGTVKKRVVTINKANVTGLYLQPSNSSVVVLTTAEQGLYVSTDGANTWKASQLTTGSVTGFAFDPSSTDVWYAGYGKNIVKTADAGQTWNVVYTDARAERISALAVSTSDPRTVYAATASGAILKSDTYGTDWKALTNIHDLIRSITIDAANPATMYLATQTTGVYRSTDFGAHWTRLNDLQKLGANTVYQLLQVSGAKTLYAATNYGVLRSEDSGSSWTALKTLIPANTLPIRTIAVDPTNPATLYFSVNNLIHKSDDAGATWQTLATIPTKRLIVRLVLDPANPATLYAGTIKTK